MRWLPSILLCLALCASAVPPGKNPAYQANLTKVEAGGGGSPQWFYIETSANDNDVIFFSGANSVSAELVVTGSGNITKVGLQIGNAGAGHNLKMGLYSNGGTLLASGSVVVDAADDDVFKEITLNVGVSNSGSVTYQIKAMGDSGDIFFYVKNPGGAMDIFNSTYASFPEDPIGTPAIDNYDRNMVAGAYLVP